MEQQNLMGYNDNARSLDNINISPLQQSGALQGGLTNNGLYQQQPQNDFYKRQLEELYDNLYKVKHGWNDQEAQNMAVLKAQYDMQHPNQQIETLQNDYNILNGNVEATPEEWQAAKDNIYNNFRQLPSEQQDMILNTINYLGYEAPQELWDTENPTEPTGTEGDVMGGYMQGGFPDTEDNTYSPFEKREGFPSTNTPSTNTDFYAQKLGGRMSNKDNMTSMKGGRFARSRQNARYNGRM